MKDSRPSAALCFASCMRPKKAFIASMSFSLRATATSEPRWFAVGQQRHEPNWTKP